MKKRKFFSNSGILKWKMPLLISILFWMSLSGTAEAEVQLRSISLRLENVSLSEALSRIEEASGYSFFYDENKIDLSRQVSVNAQNKAVKDILKNILFSTGMTFEISNNQIVLVPEKKAAAKEVSVAVVQQQTHIVKGIVVDNLGEPVPGANVVEKGTTNGIITDMDGAFSLTVAPDAVLEISYIGYVTQSVSVKGKSTLNITLREDSQALEEVVVTGFGLSQKKATLTGAGNDVGRVFTVRKCFPTFPPRTLMWAGRSPAFATARIYSPASEAKSSSVRAVETLMSKDIRDRSENCSETSSFPSGKALIPADTTLNFPFGYASRSASWTFRRASLISELTARAR